jgi:PST family polysaccharide transporter
MPGHDITLKVGFVSVWKVLATVLSFIFTFVVANFLGSAGYGTYTICIGVAELSFMIFLGFDDAITKFLAEKRLRKTLNKLLLAEVIIGVVGFVVLFTAADAISVWFGKPISLYLKVISFSLLLRPFYSVFRGVFLGFKKMRFFVASEFSLETSKLIITASLIFIGLGVLGGIVGYVLSFLVASVISYFMLRRLAFAEGGHKYRKLMGYSTKSTLFYIIRNINAQMVIIVPGLLLSSSSMGNFSLAYKLAVFAMGIIPVSLSQVLFPYFSGARKKRLERLFKISISTSLILSLPLLVVFILLARPFLNIMFPGYGEAAELIPVLGLAATFDIIGTLVLSLVKAKEKFGIGVKGLLTYTLVFSISSLMLIPSYGALGAAFSLLLSSIATGTVLMLLAKREYGTGFAFKESIYYMTGKLKLLSSLSRLLR